MKWTHYAVLDTIFGKVDSIHAAIDDALERMIELEQQQGRNVFDWDVAYYDLENEELGRLCSYVFNG